MPGTLFIVATPIGNLNDLSRRAMETLQAADVVLCEDTRVTGKLLAHFEIRRPLLSYHAHSNEMRTQEIIALLKEGKQLALVSDAGTPGINDPGGKLVERVVAELKDTVSIVPIPGPSAPIAALSASGFPADSFVYLGFPPHKKGRESFFRMIAAEEETVVFLESTHRILKALASLEQVIPNRQIMVARELTKMFETIYRGIPNEVTTRLTRDKIKGEFVVVVRRKH
ncbi:MAG: 16S rRNA (cytidine(1402)-2'-O)-methyltransferase [bacterium]|nr:16S rRNA (cytidine(1402)-2'-O)-methyltransferase [bacterium]